MSKNAILRVEHLKSIRERENFFFLNLKLFKMRYLNKYCIDFMFPMVIVSV